MISAGGPPAISSPMTWARERFEALVVIDFLVPEDLDAARVDQVQVADLVGGRATSPEIRRSPPGKPANQPSCKLSRLSSYSLCIVSGVCSMGRLYRIG
jgi:hypothetical protein